MTTLHWNHKSRLVEVATVSSRVNAALFETFADPRCATLVAAMVQPWSQRVHGEDPHAVFGRNTRNQKAAWQVLVGGISPSRPPSPSASSGSEPTCCGSWHSRLLEPHVAGSSHSGERGLRNRCGLLASRQRLEGRAVTEHLTRRRRNAGRTIPAAPPRPQLAASPSFRRQRRRTTATLSLQSGESDAETVRRARQNNGQTHCRHRADRHFYSCTGLGNRNEQCKPHFINVVFACRG